MKIPIFTSKLHRNSFFVYFEVFAGCCVLLMVLYGYLVMTNFSAAQKNQEELTEKTSTQVEAFLSELDRIALQVMGNQSISNIFCAIPDEEENYFNQNAMKKQEIQKTLLGINGPSLTVGRISIFNNQNDYVSYGFYQENDDVIQEHLAQLEYEKLLERIHAKPRKKMVIDVHEDSWCNEREPVVSVYRPLTHIASNNDLAVIETQTRLEKLYELIALKSLEYVELYVYDSNGNMVYPKVEANVMKDLGTLKDYTAEPGQSLTVKNYKDEKQNKNSLLTVKTGEDYQWTVAAVQTNSSMIRGSKNFLSGLLMLLLGFMALMLIWLFFMSKKMIEPLVCLNNSLSSVTLHNLSVKLENQEDMDVVDSLNQGFHLMFERLRHSIENEMDANLLALQAQMNPHFLYNVLSVIGAAGMEEQGIKVAVLCQKLSNMLRYSSAYEYKVVSLREETEYAQMYLDLMKARYEKGLKYHVEVQGPIEEIKVPKIMIQPMVENCFKHAFLGADYVWEVLVQVIADEKMWSVQIKDNGCGFDKKVLGEIQKQTEAVLGGKLDLEKLKIGGLGLANTVARLRMLYGESVTYQILTDENGAVLEFKGERI